MKQYELKYAQRQQQTSYLAELIELGVGGTALNSTLFKYGDLLASQESQTATTSVGQNEMCDLFYGDFDGNGVSDILKAPFYYYFIGNNGPQYKCHTGFSVYINGSSVSTFNYSVPTGILAHLANTVGNAQLITNDVDGDGKDDVIISYDSYLPVPPFQKFQLDDVQLWRSTSDGTNASFTQISIGRPNNTYQWLYPEAPREYLIPGDYDGDGKTELAFFGYDYQWNYSQVYLWRYGSGWTQQNMGSAANHFGNGKRINVGDFDGDGKWELVSRNSTYSLQCLVVGMASPNTWSILIEAAAPTADQEVFLGDFNGDGKHEFLMKTHNSSWSLSYSTGTGFTSPPWPITLSPWPDGNSKVLVGDFNGDGRSDIFHGYYSAGYKMKVAYSKGLLASGPSWDWKAFSASDGFATVGLGDFNGDGKTDVISRNYYADPSRIIYFNAKTHERRLDKISNGMNFLVDFDYRYMTEPAVYAEETWGTYNVPLPLVYSVKTSNGIGGTNADMHKYFDSRGMRNGPGFIGFLKHRMDNAVQDRRVEDSYYENGTYAALVPVKNEVSTLAAGALVRSRTYIVGGIGLGAMKRHYDRTDMVTDNDYLAGTKRVLSDFLWDAYYNVKQSKESVYHNVSSPILTSVTTTPSFVASGPYPYPSMPASEQVVATRTGQPAVTVNTTYNYVPATGALKKKTEFENKPVKLITDITYWPTGNPKETRTSYTGLNPNEHRLNSWTYDAKFRYPVTATQRWNNAGLVNISESFTYDSKWGTPLTHISTDQLQTDYTYDAFGNRTSVSAPYIPGSPRYTITEALAWDVSGNKRYKKIITHPGKPTVSTTYDLLGREVESATASFATGTYSTATTSYNSRGDVYQTTRPKLAAEATQTDTRYYDDPYGRLSSVANSLSDPTTYGYTYAGGQLTTTITDPATHVRSTTTDATGKTVQTHDDGGDLNYTYDSWGNLLTVKHGAQTLVTNTYDVYGRQTKLVDADAGTTEYLYNAFGLLTWQKNANNQVTTITYDNLGRLKTRTTPEGTNTWTYYYQGGKFNDNIVSGGGGTFTYYPLGMMATGYGRSYAYDQYDRLVSAQINSQPMQVQLNYTYTPTGYLDQVGMGSTALFDANAMNGSGRYTSYTLADGKTTTVTYDHQYPTRYYAPGVQDLRLSYNYNTGNLNDRWDKLKLRKEIFEYDALERLKKAQVHTTNSSGTLISSPGPVTYGYDGSVGGSSMGNLLQRGDIGKFGTTGAHRISQAMGPNFPNPFNDPPLAITPGPQAITYTSYHQPASISETIGGTYYLLEYTYDGDQQRNYSKLQDQTIPNDPPLEERWYDHGLETQRFDGDASSTRKILYVEGGDGLCAIIVAESGGVLTTYSVYKDHLGSIVAVTKKVGSTVTVVAEQNFDPWGRKRNSTTWAYTGVPAVPTWLYRGYTGHEHVEPFTLINMNGRMYDPLNGRMLSADNYVQGGLGTQGYNRYSYAGNNPLKFTDPSGEIVWAPIIIGAVLGAYSGGVMSNGGDFNPAKWDYNSSTTWKYMLGGAVVGGLSGAAGYAAATSGLPGANTAAIAVGSFSNSFGMHLVSGGRLPVSISAGLASYNISSGELGFLGAAGNSTMENIGYGLGALANVSDVLSGMHPAKVQLNTEKSDAIGHSSLTRVGESDPSRSFISVGPDPGGKWIFNPFKFKPGTNNWNNYVDAGGDVWKVGVDGVNLERIMTYGSNLDRGINYNLFMSSCVNHTARALTMAGAPSIGIHPFILHAQMAMRSAGIRPMLFSYYLY